MIIVSVSAGQRKQALHVKLMGTRCELFFSQEIDAIDRTDYWGRGKCEKLPTEGEDSGGLRCS